MGADGSKPSLRTQYLINFADKPLGTGAYAEVRKGKKKKDGKASGSGKQKVVAIKTIDKSKVERLSDLKREVELMGQCSHPHILKLIDAFDEPKVTHLVLEIVSGGDLFSRINATKNKRLPEAEAARVMAMLAAALGYLHRKSFVHRDVKPENILFSSAAANSAIKLADFGAARELSEQMTSVVGTPEYMPPEMLLGQAYSSPAIDIWSSGVMLHLLLGGSLPFVANLLNGEGVPALMAKIRKGFVAAESLASPAWDGVSTAARDLVTRMLDKDPTKRLSASGVSKHAWLAPDRASVSSDRAERTCSAGSLGEASGRGSERTSERTSGAQPDDGADSKARWSKIRASLQLQSMLQHEEEEQKHGKAAQPPSRGAQLWDSLQIQKQPTGGYSVRYDDAKTILERC